MLQIASAQSCHHVTLKTKECGLIKCPGRWPWVSLSVCKSNRQLDDRTFRTLLSFRTESIRSWWNFVDFNCYVHQQPMSIHSAEWVTCTRSVHDVDESRAVTCSTRTTLAFLATWHLDGVQNSSTLRQFGLFSLFQRVLEHRSINYYVLILNDGRSVDRLDTLHPSPPPPPPPLPSPPLPHPLLLSLSYFFLPHCTKPQTWFLLVGLSSMPTRCRTSTKVCSLTLSISFRGESVECFK